MPQTSPGKRLRSRWGDKIASQRRRSLREEDGKVTVGWTRRQLAEALDISEQAVGAWERGEAAPRPEHQAAIARVLDVAWDVLFQPESAA